MGVSRDEMEDVDTEEEGASKVKIEKALNVGLTFWVLLLPSSLQSFFALGSVGLGWQGMVMC